MSAPSPELHAVIGVRFSGELTYYVKRSDKMVNFPSVWSLPSLQFDPEQLTDPQDLPNVQTLMDALSEERLGGVPVTVKKHLISGDDPDSPIGRHVHLHLYEIELTEEPRLNQDYYTDSAWLTAEEYEEISSGQPCGLCLRLWSDFAWMSSITDRPFVSKRAHHG